MRRRAHPAAEEVIVKLASAQHGLVTRVQLMQAGVSRHIIDRRMKMGLLRALHAGVYQVGAVSAPHAREAAALLACGGGLISHASAAALWEMLPPQPNNPVDVTLADARHSGRRAGIRRHRQFVAKDEIAVACGLPMTSRARTIFDLSTTLAGRELERALAAGERVDPDLRDRVRALMCRYAGHGGITVLRDLIESKEPAAFTRSPPEEQLLMMIRRSGLPVPELNCDIRGFEVDCYWRQAKLVVEVDGFAYHRSRSAFIRDRQRDSALAAAGIRVLRLSWHQLVNEQERTLVQLAQALARAEA